jgi:hypothetical protein
MKNLLKFLGIIAIVAMVGFTLASCGGTTTPVVEPPDVEEPPPPDESVWKVKIPATATTNGVLERTDAGAATPPETRIAYATGSAGLKYTFASGVATLDGVTDTDPFSDTDLIIPAFALDTAASKKVDGVIVQYVYSPVEVIKEDFASLASLTTIDSVAVVARDTSSYLTEAQKKYNLKKINNGAFAGNPITDLVIPEGVEEIGNSAFDGIGAVALKIPSTVKKIGDEAFANSTLSSITFITAGSVLESIGDKAFQLTSGGGPVINLPSSLKTIGEEAFNFAYGGIIMLNGVGVTGVGPNAFEGLTSAGSLLVSGLGEGEAGLIAADALWATFNDDGDTITTDWIATDRSLSAFQGTVIFDGEAVADLTEYYTPAP